MLLYLSGHSRPDIAFAVHQCTQYTFHPTCHHELALIHIGRYLKGTMDKGLVMSLSPHPSKTVTLMLTLMVSMVMRTLATPTVLAVAPGM